MINFLKIEIIKLKNRTDDKKYDVYFFKNVFKKI